MTIVTAILKQMSGVGQPQRRFLETMIATVLAMRGRVNFRNLSRYSGYCERTISRQFRESFDWADFHQRLVTRGFGEAPELISAQDASFVPKSGKKTYGLARFFNGSASRPEKGLEISVISIIDVRNHHALTLAAEQTPPGEKTAAAENAEEETTKVSAETTSVPPAAAAPAGKPPRKRGQPRKKDGPVRKTAATNQKGTPRRNVRRKKNTVRKQAAAAAEETRMDFYCQQLRDHRNRFPPIIRYHAADGYYAKKKYVDTVVELKLDLITKFRCDTDCQYIFTGVREEGQRGAGRKYDGKVDFQDLSRFDYLGLLDVDGEKGVHLYTAAVWDKTLKRKIRLVVLVREKVNGERHYIVLGSTDLELDGRKLVELYGLRFQIEFLFRDSKQFTGLLECQARSSEALDFHFNLSLATLNVTRVADLEARPADSSEPFSMASWKQRKFNEHLLELFIEKFALDPTLIKTHPAYEELRTYGAIAA